MVHIRPVPDPSEAEQPLGPRERNRLDRHRSYVTAALSLVFTQGLDALTMQALAAEVGASVGSVYTYFPSKGALVAEVQREAIERLGGAALVLGSTVDAAAAAAGAADATARLAQVVAFGRFLLTADETHPEEMRLLLLLLSEVTQSVPPEEGARVLPAALRLLGRAQDQIEAATGAGDLDDGDAARRTIALTAALTGCVQLEVVRRWDEDLLDPTATGRLVLDSLLRGWGASAADLAAANALVDAIEANGPLARPVKGTNR